MPDTYISRAAILARCSSEANVCDQILSLKQYAAGKYVVDEDDVYGDNVSGSTTIQNRPELNRLMNNIEKGKKKYDIILIQDERRLGSSFEQVEEISNWFTHRNISLYFQDITVHK